MDIKLHKQATTTPKIRAEIQAAPSSITDSELARQYGVATATIRRWRYRDDVYDRSHTRHNLLATLTAEQEEVLITAREFLRLGLDDLLVVAREFLNPGLSRSALHRMLKRREVPTLAELARQDAGGDEKPRHKPFKDYEPGYVHIDIKHLPQMPDEEQKRYLYVAIDRATRWVYLEVRRSQSAKDARAFMKQVEKKAPFKIQTVLTDNGLPAVAVASWTKRSLLMSA
ncbi:DDE-type integrase/transposase/recombinase [Billgrantia kenyensis]|uniref:DDE-type integrase/transposase/recombinase n=1 Tax=Billgrantia kenyensis TaxID=321266 RepID=UPI0023AE7DFA|nr:DDE-type integrase/transposase/recombinase [Halomonas kenyensis]